MSTPLTQESDGLMDKVSASRPKDRGFEPWFLIWHQYWLVPGSGLESDSNKLLTFFTIELKQIMFKLTLSEFQWTLCLLGVEHRICTPGVADSILGRDVISPWLLISSCPRIEPAKPGLQIWCSHYWANRADYILTEMQ